MADSRNKGKNYENYIVRMFREAGWTDAKRHLEFQSEEAVEGRDLDNTEPFAVQIKCWKKAPPITAIMEVVPDNDYAHPLAVLKRTRSAGVSTLEVAVIDLNVFMKMLFLLRENGLFELLG